MPFYPFLGGGVPRDNTKQGYPYSNLSPGGPSLYVLFLVAGCGKLVCVCV